MASKNSHTASDTKMASLSQPPGLPQTLSLSGKTAIISGAARGQGAVEARMFVDAGAKVILGDVLDDQGMALAEEINSAASAASSASDSAAPARFIHLDVTSSQDWQLATEAAQALGHVNVLVNNAGIHWVKPLLDENPEEAKRMLEVNAIGTLLGIQAVADLMRQAGSGSIVNISSVAGLHGIHGHTAYGMSKWAVRGLTKVAALELGPLGIRVNSIHPGPIRTEMLPPHVRDKPEAFSHLPLGRSGEPEEVARLALYLASDYSSYQTGGEYTIDGGGWAGHPLR